MDMEQEQPQPVEAPAPAAKKPSAEELEALQKAAKARLSTARVEGYHPNNPVGALVRKIADGADVDVGNVPAADAEPIVSYVRWDHTAAEALDELARICGAKWDVSGGALNFVLG